MECYHSPYVSASKTGRPNRPSCMSGWVSISPSSLAGKGWDEGANIVVPNGAHRTRGPSIREPYEEK